MPQGKSKLNAAKQSSGGKKKVADKKKGLRAIAPKNKQTVRQATQHKKMSAKINNSIEQQMIAAASAGKLTIMRGAAEEGYENKRPKGGKK
ncbi:hypothetical protein FFLO_03056 [Filobasidium floriforme]|uniref:Uncharacterized protein n=1 Tax=Filobasidium floriforme TaxID=5210 RepID=A0A8K0JM64_9TREE|nr:uncharacterized protein HD553DRAFT_351576 [Filobasidium floriforme]KAG7553549.1 hypothetical protein FFLO_03056 [Filobasidium floriforme]KAH8081476.1 hypothetical protein HD553DRAFT_351576 [Filobasidium floriforme]